MYPALNLVEAGPAAGALIFTIISFTGAGLTADGTVTLVVKGIVRDFMIAQVLPDGLASPVGHGVELDNVSSGGFIESIEFDNADG